MVLSAAADTRAPQNETPEMWRLRAKIDRLKVENAALRKGLDDAATSLCTISQQAGRTEELSEMSQIRGYAFSRYSAAIDAARTKDTQP
jgi:hypothetical protein